MQINVGLPLFAMTKKLSQKTHIGIETEVVFSESTPSQRQISELATEPRAFDQSSSGTLNVLFGKMQLR